MQMFLRRDSTHCGTGTSHASSLSPRYRHCCKVPFTFWASVLCIVSSTFLCSSGAASLVLRPNKPLVNVPFSVETTDQSIKADIFVSRMSTCDNTQIIGSKCKISKNAPCNFTVTSNDVGIDPWYDTKVREVYICAGDAFPSLSLSVQLSLVEAIPRYLKRDVDNTIRFGDAVPVGTFITFHRNENCDDVSMIQGLPPAELGSNREVRVTRSVQSVIYLCAKVPTSDGKTFVVPASVLLAVPRYDTNNTDALRHTNETFRLEAVGNLVWATFSQSPLCDPILQDPVGGETLQVVNMEVSVPKGDYFLCNGWPYHKGGRLYSPSENKVTVREYGVQPRTLYSGYGTRIKYTMDAATAAANDVKLVLDFYMYSNCTGAVRVDGPSGIQYRGPPVKKRRSRSDGGAVALPVSGTYYACLEGSTTAYPKARAAVVTVLPPPTVSFDEANVISGLDLTVLLSGHNAGRSGVITVGLSVTPECEELNSKGDVRVGASSVTFRVPEDALPNMTLCVATPSSVDLQADEEPDEGYTYPVKNIATRRYKLKHRTLFVGVAETIHLDANVTLKAGTTGYFSLDNCLTPVGETYSMNATALYGVAFSTAGRHVLCVKTPGTEHPVNRPYSNVGNVMVYGPAELSPASIVKGVSTPVKVSAVPPEAPIVFSESESCTPSISEVNATAEGEASVTVMRNTVGKVYVCVGYHDSDGGAWKVRVSGMLAVSDVEVFPRTVFVGVSNRVNFIVPDKTSLKGLKVLFKETSDVNCGEIVDDGTAVAIRITEVGPAYVVYTAVGMKKWKVCLWKGNGYEDVGLIQSQQQLELVPDSPIGVVGLPLSMRFRGEALTALQPTRFLVSESIESCQSAPGGGIRVYGEGWVDPISGSAEPFVVQKAGELHVCVGWGDTNESYYLYGGKVSAEDFAVDSLYAVRRSTNNFVARPLLKKASLFLVRCVNAASCKVPLNARICEEATERYYTGPTTPLEDVLLGEYALCQQDERRLGVAVGQKPLKVINPFTASFNVSLVRKHTPLRLTLDGGSLHIGASNLTVYIVPPELNCTEANASYDSFPFASGEHSKDVTIVKTPAVAKGARVCVGISAYDKLPASTFNIFHYMTPATIIAGRSVTVESSGIQSGRVRISTLEACTDSILSEYDTVIANSMSTLHVDKCKYRNRDLTDVYYCERGESGGYVMRGTMQLIHLDECPGGKQPAVRPVTALPAKQVTDYGIDKAILTSPFLSTRSDCNGVLSQSRATMTPRYNRNLTFYVCTHTIRDPGYVFTTDGPTLSVENFRVVNPSIHGRVDSDSEVLGPANLVMNYATRTPDTYLSDCAVCGEKIVAAPGLAETPVEEAVTLIGISGVKCVCVLGEQPTSPPIPVAEVLIITPPIVKKIDPAAVPTARFHAKLQTPVVSGAKPLYSLVPGEDAENPLAYLHNSDFRGVYLSENACATTLTGNSVGYVRPSGSVVLGPTFIPGRLPSVSLCVGTPAGNLSVVSEVEVSTDIIFPSSFVLGTEAEVYIPLSPNSAFRLRRDASCGGEDVVPFFTTDEEARGNISFKNVNAAGLPSAGVWTLCQEVFDGSATRPKIVKISANGIAARVASAKQLLPIAQIETFDPTYYNIRGRDVLLGVPGVLYLMDDLYAESLLPGFSTDRSCLRRNESHGSWALVGDDDAASARRVSVTAQNGTDSIYFCATTPVNRSVVSVPLSSSLRFIPPVSVFPSIVEPCKVTPLESCRAPDSSHRQTVVRVIKGDCCNPTDKGVTVGEASEGSDGKCKLRMNHNKIRDYPAGTEFSVCAWDLTDNTYCVTLGNVKASGDICGGSAWGPLGMGAVIAIIVAAVLLFLLLLLLAVCFLRRCCSKEKEERQLVVADKMQLDNLDMSCISGTSPDPEYLESGNNPLLLGFYSGDGSPNTNTTARTMIDGMTSGVDDFAWGGDFPGRADWTSVEEQECDDRDQIALQEARDRYNMALVFTDGIERIRVDAKELELQFDYSGEFSMYEGPTGRGVNVNPIPVTVPADHPDLLNAIYMRRASQRRRLQSQTREEIEVSVHDTMSEMSTDVHDTSRLTSYDMMSYTTTQHFYEESTFMLESEAGRRMRLVNWEEEEWQAIVDAEFSDYVRLQQAMRSIPLPLPQAVVLPFNSTATRGRDTINYSGHTHVDGEGVTVLPVYDTPPFHNPHAASVDEAQAYPNHDEESNVSLSCDSSHN
ncbi:hypothetical protein, conserved [Trypanosoma brucei brucei TREU927]|uniref:Uncharacterized protein n=1 Tax=Trypanosoma brucei brucei (strain 927/4 GUTat10.1) TaxID=185431 RepID=Q57YD7_TRYB2|nr:hypothetical protein, conserved [Trypanosoma brucei brucei TREU927]AAX69382.1 hypothetical protein, conserved [Trypanosoma brucei]AAZ12865.1 hypothetical protein, conserved [Trypanosoma brucei brucei TREU927]